MSEAVLLIGGGGREHALAEAMIESPDLDHLYCAPGNPGTAMFDRTENLPFGPADTDSIVSFACRSDDDLTVVVGPEAPLVGGLADALRAEGAVVFGPNAAAARLEGSKIFACKFMDEQGISQPAFNIVTTNIEAQSVMAGRDPRSIVLKADGLAGGKGVVLPKTETEAEETVCAMLSGEGFDGAGKDGVVIQERLSGPEVSVFVISDGQSFNIVPMFAQDHKRRDDGDEGPNTGGMGAYTPVPEGMINPRQMAGIHLIAGKTIDGMARTGSPYEGVLYMGLMLADQRDGDPVVIEYNCRWGDPEAQVILPTLTASGVSVYDVLYETSRGLSLDLGSPQFAGRAALTVCLAAEGYPERPRKGAVIHGLDAAYPDVAVHHGCTRQAGDEVVVNGGRVLYVTGQGQSVDAAAAAAYAAIGQSGIHFDGMHYRTDIGHQARGVV